MATVKLTSQNFNEIVEKNKIVFIDFWAEWCGPCKQYGPIFEEVSNEFEDVVFGKVNTEEEQEIAAYFQIRSIPTTAAIKEGIVVFMQPGLLPKEALQDVVKQVIELDMDKVREEIAKEEAKNQQ